MKGIDINMIYSRAYTDVVHYTSSSVQCAIRCQYSCPDRKRISHSGE